MTVIAPKDLNFLFRFEAGSQVFAYAEDLEVSVGDDVYEAVQIDHSLPTFAEEPQQSEIDISIHEAVGLMDLFINGPPPFPVKLRIYEYDYLTEVATPWYRGWVVRTALELDRSIASLHCKTVWHFFDRESQSESVSTLSRYSIYDPRSQVDTSTLGQAVTVTAMNDERDVVTVSGASDLTGYYDGGIIIAPNLDRRTILQDVVSGLTRQLSLNAAFPQFTLSTGFNAELLPGDDLTYATWANKFDSITNNGEKFGGWLYTPNVDPAKKGVL